MDGVDLRAGPRRLLFEGAHSPYRSVTYSTLRGVVRSAEGDTEDISNTHMSSTGATIPFRIRSMSRYCSLHRAGSG